MARTLQFEKLHGAGNDFVFFEDMSDELNLTADQVIALCDRHFGIGADGVIVVKPPKDPSNDGFMHYVNSDGTIAQMCGNGVRCFAKYLVDHDLVNPDEPVIKVETRAGVKAITYTTDDLGKLITATVDMGAPMFEPSLVPVNIQGNAVTDEGVTFVKDAAIESPFGTFEFTCVSMGNPHAVTFVDDVETFDVVSVGAYFESCALFPEKANIEFATVSADGIHMRVYERGCGETLACGTGACATGVAAFLTGRARAESDLILRGGTLHIAYEPGNAVLMTGPAKQAFTGTVSV